MARRKPEKPGSETGPAVPPAPAKAGTRGKLLVFVISLLLFALTVAAFLPCLGNGFVNFDDDVYVYDNTRVQHGLTGENIRWAFTTLEAGFWHPLTWCSLFLDEQFHGMNSRGYHLTNILLHAASTVLLFLLLRRMTGAVWRSAFVAALFAMHPLHVEPVAWVASRKDVLSTVFWMLSLLMYVLYAEKRKPGDELSSGKHNPALPFAFYILSFFFFACGLMSKTMVVTLPVILMVLDFWPLGRLRFGSGKARWWPLLEKVPFFAASLACGLLTMHAEKKVGAMEMVSTFPLGLRITNAAFGCGRYLIQTVWPEGMAPFYPYPQTFPILGVAGAAVLILAVTAAVLGTGRRRPYLAFGWFWYLITLAPVSGLIQVGSHSRADRYTYIPLIGIFAMAAWGVYELTGRWPRQTLMLSVIAAAVLFLTLLRARAQMAYWKDSETLFRHALVVTANNNFAHNNLGLALLQKGQLDDAIVQFNDALTIDPAYSKPHNNLGIALLDKGRTDEAIAQFQAALGSRQDFADVSYNLGVAYLRSERPRDAIGEFQRALASRPDLTKANYGLASAFLRSGQTSNAILQFRKALELDPAYGEAHSDLGLALLRSGRTDDAIAQFREALKVRPDAYEASYNLGLALLQQGRVREAIAPLETAIRLRPAFTDARLQLAAAFLQTGHVGDALTQFQAASAAQPDNPILLNNIAWILATSPDSTLRNGARAVELAQKAQVLTKDSSPSILGTLAAAYAEAGKMPEALASAQRALSLATAGNDSNLADALRHQLESYRAGKAFRDEPATNAVP